MKILPVIMCGGSGTRVWPASRESLPKQFIPLVGENSTFQMAMEVLSDAVFEMPVVISNHAYRFLLSEQLLAMKRLAHIVLEPEGSRLRAGGGGGYCGGGAHEPRHDRRRSRCRPRGA